MAMAAMSAMAMPAMHQEVHEDAGERKQIEQRPKDMGAVLGEEQEPPDREERE